MDAWQPTHWRCSGQRHQPPANATSQRHHLIFASTLSSLVQVARDLGLPWTAWSLHMRCDPSMLQDRSGGGCGVGMQLQLTAWGSLVRGYLLAA